jgi:hypothetical protein
MRLRKHRKSFLILTAAISLGGSLYWALGAPQYQELPNCVRVPIRFSFLSHKPLLTIDIQGTSYTIMLDTGSSHPLDLHQRVLEKIPEKQFVQTEPYYDLRGDNYLVSQFILPELKIQKRLKIAPHDSFFRKLRSQLDLRFIDGRIGWSLFKKATCLCSFHKSLLILAKNTETLQQHELFKPDDFWQQPLEISKYGPLFLAQTEDGPKRFLLDTGSSSSIYRHPDPKSAPKITLNLQTKEGSLGPWDFWPYAIDSKISEEIDGVLGIDFFNAHVICLDFQQQRLYIQKKLNDLLSNRR